jgi:DnaJ-class molecular chaperone
MSMVRCLGCRGRGFTVTLGQAIVCGRCKGSGEIDLQREWAERRAEDARLQREVEEALDEMDTAFGDLGDDV